LAFAPVKQTDVQTYAIAHGKIMGKMLFNELSGYIPKGFFSWQSRADCGIINKFLISVFVSSDMIAPSFSGIRGSGRPRKKLSQINPLSI
jgi:hypothetical protein